jgi:TonB family protein
MDGVGVGLEQGDATWLQAREFKYATFMNRMRNEIGQQWIPRVRDAQRQRDPDGSLFFYKERTVVLGLTLDTNGNVRDLSVLQSSSVDFFDRVAVSSVQAAQPFPNPPAGMFHSEHEVRIPFSFTMYPGDGHAALFWRAPQP